MSEYGVYPSSVPYFLGDVEFKVAVPDPDLVVEVTRCNIVVVRGVVQVVQNWLQEFRFRPEVRIYNEVARFLSFE